MDLQPAGELLTHLVACPSVNPKKQIPSDPPFGEERMVNLLDKLLSSWGAETQVIEVLPGRQNLIAKFSGRDSSKSLMLEAHSDTVQVEGMTIDPFGAKIQDGRLYGRGACDDKGPMAAMLLGIKEVLDMDGQPPVSVYFVSCCDEELGATGAHHLMKSGVRADAAVVAEPTELKIVHAHKGALRWRITTHGVAGHSSDPASGVNAINQMSKLLDVLEKIVNHLSVGKGHSLLGKPTLSVGTIEGGSQVNIIPDSCAIEVDRRVVPGEDRQTITRDLNTWLSKLKEGNPHFQYDLKEIEWYPPMEEDKDSPVARLVEEACKKILGSAEFTTAPWAANSGPFKGAGVPCVLFGPGSIKQAHTKDEFIELSEVAGAAKVYAEMIRNS